MSQETSKMAGEKELKNLEKQIEKDIGDLIFEEEEGKKSDSSSQTEVEGEKEFETEAAKKAEETYESEEEDEELEELSDEEFSEEEDEEEEFSEEEDEEDAEQGTKKRKGLFRKKEKKDKKDEMIKELNDKYLRQIAEFDNYRKRTEKEKSQMFEVGAKSVIEKILPIVDNFERGLAAVSEEEMEQPFVDGMNKIYKQLISSLEEIDVKPIEAVGCVFDPNLHNAVMVVEDSGQEEDTIVSELQKGYTYRDTVVRHSMVQVAK